MNQLIKPNYLDIFAYLRNTTVSLETYPLYSFDFQSVSHQSLPTFYFFVDLTNVYMEYCHPKSISDFEGEVMITTGITRFSRLSELASLT